MLCPEPDLVTEEADLLCEPLLEPGHADLADAGLDAGLKTFF